MRRAVILLLVVLPTAALGAWLAANTEWTEATVPFPPRGEAATNPFYAVQRFAQAVGARPVRAPGFPNPPPDAVVVLSGWHWGLSRRRADAVKQWVEAGGRLVVDNSVVGIEGDFERWSGVAHADLDADEIQEALDERGQASCHRVGEPGDTESEAGTRVDGSTRHWLCDAGITPLVTARPAIWTLGDDSGTHVVRMAVGRGHVTYVNAEPFTQRRLFDGDHDWLFVEATQLEKGDAVFFLSEDDYPSLLALLWRRGAPLVVLGLALLGAAIWRSSDRHGPLALAGATARRSLAEQLRGTGQFLARHDAEALRTAAARVLDEAASRRIDGYTGLTPAARVEAVARMTDLPQEAVEAALHGSERRTFREVRSSLALLETARRRLAAHQEPRHGVY